MRQTQAERLPQNPAALGSVAKLASGLTASRHAALPAAAYNPGRRLKEGKSSFLAAPQERGVLQCPQPSPRLRVPLFLEAPTLRLSSRDCRCFSAAPRARSLCRSSARSARLAAPSAAAISPPPSAGGSMRPAAPPRPWPS